MKKYLNDSCRISYSLVPTKLPEAMSIGSAGENETELNQASLLATSNTGTADNRCIGGLEK